MIIKIDLEKELQSYNIEDKYNDYIGMQKEIIGTLKAEGYFKNNVIINEASEMQIRINPRGIKETLGSGMRFQNLPRVLKRLKIATIRKLPEIIRQGELLEDNVINFHGNNYLYAYFVTPIMIDEVKMVVKVNVRKSIEVNKFWIHNVLIEKEL